MRIALGAGHTIYGAGSGAVGYINESKENRVMNELVAKWLKADGNSVYDCTVDYSSNYLPEACAKANKQSVDLAVQIHFNANTTTSNPMGTETLYYGGATGTNAAKRVTEKLGTKFKQRGAKQNQGLYWLKHTSAPAILVEVCFCDSKADVDIYNANKDAIAKLIAEGIVGHSIAGSSSSNEYPIGTYQKDVIVDTKDGSNLNARSGRGTEFGIVGSFKNGSKVNVWYIDKAKDGALWGSCSCNDKTAYIHMGYTRPAN